MAGDIIQTVNTIIVNNNHQQSIITTHLNMPFKKGDPNINRKGRWTPNKFTTLKQSFMDAYEAIGGTQALVDWMTKDTTLSYVNKKTGKKVTIDISGDRKKEFFKMMSAMLPKEVQVSEVPLDKESLIAAIQGMKPDEIKDLLKAVSSS